MPVIRTHAMSFDASVPVLVVGAGATGMTAALAAADAGADVMVLERDASPTGTTSMAQGFICAAATRAQKDKGVSDSAEAMFADIMTKTRGQTDERLARSIARESGPTIDWLMADHDFPFDVELAWRTDFGHSVPRLHGLPSRSGTELLGRLIRAGEGRVSLTTNAHVVDVYADDMDRVLGVGLLRPDGTRETIGCAALVLATCGFGANREMVRRFIPEMGDSPYFGHEGDDGEGIQWGMQLGAATADMTAFQGYGALSIESGVLVNYNLIMEGGIQINLKGERFSNELFDISGQSKQVLAQPSGIAWVVYDDRLRQSNLRWPEYQALTKLGMVKSAPDAAGLAQLIGVPATTLQATLAHAIACANGDAEDPFGRDFGRNPPLSSEGPYFAAKVTGALFHTQGGLVVDDTARVMRADGSPMPNLFAGGGTARSISGPGVWGYLPAAGLCMAVTLGRLAGQAAARQA
ncbi:FAD-dependent oxidoreductase [Bradyrhizobium oligotrophicum]|uniref:FAD-dependent oxidoreductase n=1 Tax=Bradyrhizobium oligotrophicum TaxID=44255 RepID=UPI003EB885E8